MCGGRGRLVSRELSRVRGRDGVRHAVEAKPVLGGAGGKLEQVVAFYVSPPDKASVQHDLPPRLALDATSASHLVAFLLALSSPAE